MSIDTSGTGGTAYVAGTGFSLTWGQTKSIPANLFDRRDWLMTVEEAWGAWHSHSQNLLGRMLTIVDASFSDLEQRKAVKDLVRSEFYRCGDRVAGDIASQCSIAEQAIAERDQTEVMTKG